MKQILITILINYILFSIPSCATLPDEPLSKGELRLIRIETPEGESLHANLPFMVKITFQSEGTPNIQKACFYWSGDGPYCYRVSNINYEPQGNFTVWLRIDKGGIYNLECYVQYLYGSELRASNIIDTQISLR